MSQDRKDPLINEKKVLDDLESWDLIKEVGNIFLETQGETLSELEKAVKTHDSKRIEHYAHKIKGASAIFGADEIVEVAQTLEDLGERGDLARTPELLDRLVARSAEMRMELKCFLKRRPAA